MALGDIFVCFYDVDMPGDFCWPTANCKVGLAILRSSSFTSRWRYKYDAIMTDQCVQDRPLMKHKKSEANRIMYDVVMRTSCLMARRGGATERVFGKSAFFSITFDQTGLQIDPDLV